MKLTITLLGLLLGSTLLAQWQDEGPGTFSPGEAYYLDLAVDDDTIFVAFRDNANGNRASLMKFDGTNYTYVGSPGFSAGGAQFTKLDFFNNFN